MNPAQTVVSTGQEPRLRVGLADGLTSARISTQGQYRLDARRIEPGTHELRITGSDIELIDEQGCRVVRARQVLLTPDEYGQCSFTLPENSIGRDFHWQRSTSQTYHGALEACCFDSAAMTLINQIALEEYLEAVVCSEMNPRSPEEFLKAHCVISRSWVLAQLQRCAGSSPVPDAVWTDAAAHAHYDVCNDDHCQRYHGIGAINAAARSALAATRGEVLWSDEAVCDARFSKCCGGITERFSTCWQDVDYSYLQPRPDCAPGFEEFFPPLSDEAATRRFVEERPAVFCNVTNRDLLETILPDFDYETGDFFRWQVRFAQDELRESIMRKTGRDFGDILRLEPLRRGGSGRIIALRITGSHHTEIISKELAVRRALSPSHLYSSAFVIDVHGTGTVPDAFVLRGAGWGHGVGLCQIGAAVMAHAGYDYRLILAHYFQGAQLQRLY